MLRNSLATSPIPVSTIPVSTGNAQPNTVMTMKDRRRYRKKSNQFVTAVQLALDTDGFVYRKWGSEQRCKQGDWLVDNAGEVYTIDRESFEQTYRRESPGVYVKKSTVWAEVTKQAGSVETKEGTSHYQAGDYLVSNQADGTDAYCINSESFDAMYELDELDEKRDEISRAKN
ncbi:MAG: hypothetical protein O3A00_06810 [Planctomycetota bacterium]|nr:hypothetical protein [Planctomycetota bacterium]